MTANLIISCNFHRNNYKSDAPTTRALDDKATSITEM